MDLDSIEGIKNLEINSNFKKKKLKLIVLPIVGLVMVGVVILNSKKTKLDYKFNYKPYLDYTFEEFDDAYRIEFGYPNDMDESLDETDERLYYLYDWITMSSIDDPILFDVLKQKKSTLYNMSYEMHEMISNYALENVNANIGNDALGVTDCDICTENEDGKTKYYIKLYQGGVDGIVYKNLIKDKKIQLILNKCEELKSLGISKDSLYEEFNYDRFDSGRYEKELNDIDKFGKEFIKYYVEVLNCYGNQVVDTDNKTLIK